MNSENNGLIEHLVEIARSIKITVIVHTDDDDARLIEAAEFLPKESIGFYGEVIRASQTKQKIMEFYEELTNLTEERNGKLAFIKSRSSYREPKNKKFLEESE